MMLHIRIESTAHPRFDEFGRVRNVIEKSVAQLLQCRSYGGEGVVETVLIVLRIYPKQRFTDYPDAYKPTLTVSKRLKVIVVSADFHLEDLDELEEARVFDAFVKAVVQSIEKLKERKSIGIQIDELSRDLSCLSFT